MSSRFENAVEVCALHHFSNAKPPRYMRARGKAVTASHHSGSNSRVSLRCLACGARLRARYPSSEPLPSICLEVLLGGVPKSVFCFDA
jgi:hypothetical protein